MVAKREDYKVIVNYVATRGSVSYHRARVLLSELGKVMQEAVACGDNLDIPGIFKIEYTSVKEHIHTNRNFGLDRQIAEVAKRTGMGKNEVEKIIRLYYMRMKDLIEIGYHVNVKGIGYVIPKEDENGVFCDTRVSPVLEKPDMADFMVLGQDGTLSVEQIHKEDLRFSITLSEDIKVPYKVLKNNELKIEVVDI